MRVENPAVTPVEASDVSAPKASSVSPRKQAANRANAARSTGPRTAEGKARSSLNAVSHGLTGRTVVLPGEDPEQFAELEREMLADLRPRGALERQLVKRIVGLLWRLDRASRLEGAMWQQSQEARARHFEVKRMVRQTFKYPLWPGESDEPPVPEDGDAFLAEQFEKRNSSPVERLGIYEQRLDRLLNGMLRQLQQLQKNRIERGEPPEEVEPPAPPASEPSIEQNEPTAESPAEPVADAPQVIPQNEPTAAAVEPGLLTPAPVGSILPSQ